MAAIGPRRAGVGQPEVGLVHERGGLQRLARPLAPHVGGGHAPQLVVDERSDIFGFGWLFFGHMVRLKPDTTDATLPSLSCLLARHRRSRRRAALFPPAGGFSDRARAP